MRRVQVFLACALALLSARPASAADPVDVCIEAHAAGQVDEQDGALRRAHQRYLQCSQSSCPPLVQKECAQLLDRLGPTIPRFVVRATKGGAETSNVRVSVDGEWVEPTLSGRPVLVDPGERVVAVDFGEARVVQRRVVFRQGAALTVLDFEAPSATSDRPSRAARPFPTLAVAFTGLAALGVGSFAFFGLRGYGAESDLERRCGPPCTENDLAPVRRDYLVADISLGVAIVSAGLATWFFLNPPGARSER